MAKKILFFCLSIFLIFQSYKLINIIPLLEIESFGMTVFMAWLVTLFVTGIFAFAGFGFPTQDLIPDSYYKIHQPKRLKKIYKSLNVNAFRKMLLATLWKNKEQRKKFFDGTMEGIENLEIQSKKSDIGHSIPFVILIFISLYFLSLRLNALAIWIFIINIIGNLYPVILQRHHRMRIQLLRKRQNRKKA